MKWPRVTLVVCNSLIALAMLEFAIVKFIGDRERFLGLPFWSRPLCLLAGAVGFSVLAYLVAKHRGRVLQTLAAVGALGFSAFGWWLTPLVYCVFSLCVVWRLEDLVADDTPKPLRGTPESVARRMWSAGESHEVIRAELAARQMPADEIERLVYELTVEAVRDGAQQTASALASKDSRQADP